MDLPFSEWSREAKDEFAQKRMEEMKLKNEALKQRHAEVEQDRLKAEAKHSAVTCLKISKKENQIIDKEIVEDYPKITKEREWDREKIDQDAEDWSPPRFQGYRSRAQRRNFPDRRTPKKEENWRVRSNVSRDRQTYSKFRSSGPSHKFQDSSNYGTSSFRNDNANASRQRGRAHRATSGTYRSFHNSRFDEPRKKSISGGVRSASPSLSDSERDPIKPQPKPEVERMWQDGGVTEIQHKQSRIEKWVKAVNTGSSWNEEYDHAKRGDYYAEKRIEPGSRDTAMNYGFTNEEGYSKKAQFSRDQSHFRNRERYEGSKYGQSRGNSRSRGSRTPTRERTSGGFESRNQRDFRKRNYSDKNRVRRESDLSDRTSSMKESDHHDWSKDKFNKMSDSKSSDYSGKWEDEECELKYVSERRSIDKPSSEHIYGKDKFNKPNSVRVSSVSGCQDGMKKDNFDDEYCWNTPQTFPNSYVKDQAKNENVRNIDHGEFDDQRFDNRPVTRKVDYTSNKAKPNKYKTESKFVGYSRKYDDESAGDNYARASHKYKVNRPSPKRNPSNPVKSVETSSSASKTMEFNSPDDDGWGEYEDTGIEWHVDGIDTKAEGKSNLSENKDEKNEASLTLESGTPKKTHDKGNEKIYNCSELKLDQVSGDAVPEELHGHSNMDEKIGEVKEQEALISSKDSVEGSNTNKDFTGVTKDQKLYSYVSVESKEGCYSESLLSSGKTGEMQIHDAEKDHNVLVDEKHEGYNADVEYSADQDEGEVQSTESGQTRNELINYADLQQACLKFTQENSENNSSFSSGDPLDKSPEAILKKTACTKENSESALQSSNIVSAESQFPKLEENIENNSGALNLSDDGAWSTVSEEEN